MRACVPPQSLRLACQCGVSYLVWPSDYVGYYPTLSRHVSLSWFGTGPPVFTCLHIILLISLLTATGSPCALLL